MITVVSASMPKGCFFFDVLHTNIDHRGVGAPRPAAQGAGGWT